jgi:protein-disulfide isomerase
MSKKTDREARAAAAAAALADQRRRERRRSLLSISAVVVAMLVIVGAGFVVSSRTSSGPSGRAADPGSGTAVTVGSKGAAHEVVVYEDFLCPFCGELEKRTHMQLADLAGQGRVSVTYRPFNLLDTDYSQQSLEVFEAVQHTAGDTVAKKLHDVLYAQQPDERGPWPKQSALVDLAVQAGADRSAVTKAIDDGDAKRWADASTKAAVDAHVLSTPTVLVDGQELAGRTVDETATKLLKAVS